MPKRNAEQKAARQIQAAEGISYQEALKRVRAADGGSVSVQPARAAIAYVRQPSAAEAELGITVEELGVDVLPAGASPAQRARAEAVWRPAGAEGACRCSKVNCHHGQRCTVGEGAEQDLGYDPQCSGRMLHLDRFPGSMFELTIWYDLYRCSECGEGFETSLALPHLPWGEVRQRDQLDGKEMTLDSGGPTVTVIYPGIRHPNFESTHQLDYDCQDDLTEWLVPCGSDWHSHPSGDPRATCRPDPVAGGHSPTDGD